MSGDSVSDIWPKVHEVDRQLTTCQNYLEDVSAPTALAHVTSNQTLHVHYKHIFYTFAVPEDYLALLQMFSD